MAQEGKKIKKHVLRMDSETYASDIRYLYTYAIELTSGALEDPQDIDNLIFGIETERDGRQHSPAGLVAEGRTNEAMKLLKTAWERRLDKINKYNQMLKDKNGPQVQTTKLFRNR